MALKSTNIQSVFQILPSHRRSPWPNPCPWKRMNSMQSQATYARDFSIGRTQMISRQSSHIVSTYYMLFATSVTSYLWVAKKTPRALKTKVVSLFYIMIFAAEIRGTCSVSCLPTFMEKKGSFPFPSLGYWCPFFSIYKEATLFRNHLASNEAASSHYMFWSIKHPTWWANSSTSQEKHVTPIWSHMS